MQLLLSKPGDAPVLKLLRTIAAEKAGRTVTAPDPRRCKRPLPRLPEGDPPPRPDEEEDEELATPPAAAAMAAGSAGESAPVDFLDFL